jgi:hypothetical protein
MKIQFIVVAVAAFALWACNNDLDVNPTEKKDQQETVVVDKWEKVILDNGVEAYECNGFRYIPWPKDVVEMNTVVKTDKTKGKTKSGGYPQTREHTTGSMTLFDNGRWIPCGTVTGILHCTVGSNGLCMSINTNLDVRYNQPPGIWAAAKFVNNKSVAKMNSPYNVSCHLIGKLYLKANAATFGFDVPLSQIPQSEKFYTERFELKNSGNGNSGNSGNGNGSGSDGNSQGNFNGYPGGGKIVEAYYDSECREFMGIMQLWFAASIGAKSYIDTSWPGVCHRIQ